MRPVLVVVVLMAASMPAGADPLPSPSNFDGLWVSGGPIAAASRVGGSWAGSGGLEVSVDLVRSRLLVGLGGGGLGYAGHPGGRVWLEGVVGERFVGVAIGPTASVDGNGIAHVGAQGTIWLRWGLVPFVRVGTLVDEGRFVEAGVAIELPAFHFFL